ncbi:hypothetical protein M569_04850 [Genlisea aurea]|uniref:GATA-type domain-containing protein n=1 Tax=Genlisea aurea TaxID=192259 RepID=S8CSV2_9LAMI|nr:hypothetical protein M569_04850 [Genlisea aurea]
MAHRSAIRLSKEHGEYMTARLMMEFAVGMPLQHVILEGDCLALIQTLNHPSTMADTRLDTILQDILHLTSGKMSNKGKGESQGGDEKEEEKLDLTLSLGHSSKRKETLNKKLWGYNIPTINPNTITCSSSSFNTHYQATTDYYKYSYDGAMPMAINAAVGNVVVPPSPSNYAYGRSDMASPNRKRNAHESRVCRDCGATMTPLWRKGPAGRQTLCNACGLKHLRMAKKDGH